MKLSHELKDTKKSLTILSQYQINYAPNKDIRKIDQHGVMYLLSSKWVFQDCVQGETVRLHFKVPIIIALCGIGNDNIRVRNENPFMVVLRPPRGVCEAHLHLAGKPYVIATIPSQTYRIVLW